MKKIKVVEFVTRLEFGGVEAVLLNYIRNFSHKDDFEFHVITQDVNAQGCVEQFEKSGFIVHIVTHKRKSIIKNVKEIFRILKREKFDVVHSHMTLTNFYVLFMAWITGTRLRISHSHNAFVDETGKKTPIWAALKFLNRLPANCWMTCGCEAGEFLWGKKAMECNKVHMMNNAIAVDKFKFDVFVRNKVRHAYGLEDALCIGNIGRFSEQKNHKFLVDIFAEIWKSNRFAKLLLVGSGELEDQIRQYVYEKGLQEQVIFTGSVTNPHEFYQAMDVFVLPSLYEGLPVVAIEAQTADLPCFFSDRIDKSCAITDKVRFLSIQSEAVHWANEILNLSACERSEEPIRKIEEAGYNIVTKAEKLQEIYRSNA